MLIVKAELNLELCYFQFFTRHNLFLFQRDFYYIGANFLPFVIFNSYNSGQPGILESYI